jgi:hypothetical protein
VAPAATPANPITPGLQTSEGKLAAVAVALGVLGTIAPALLELVSSLRDAYPHSALLATAASAVGMIVTALIATGYAKQRTALKVAALRQGGFARVHVLLGLTAVSALALGCATMSHAVVDTGDVDLGKGVVSRTTSAPTDPVSCTQLWTQNVTFPLPHDSAGTCLFDDIAVAIPFEPGRGAQCKVSAGPGAVACTKLVATSCTVPIPRDAAGACP